MGSQSKNTVCANCEVFNILSREHFAHTAFLLCQTIMLYLHAPVNKQREGVDVY